MREVLPVRWRGRTRRMTRHNGPCRSTGTRVPRQENRTRQPGPSDLLTPADGTNLTGATNPASVRNRTNGANQMNASNRTSVTNQ
jgi:hypothetical protein